MKWQIAAGMFLVLGLIVLTLGLALSEMPRMELFKASNDARTSARTPPLRSTIMPRGAGLRSMRIRLFSLR